MSLEAVTFYCNCWAQASTFLDVAVTVHWDYCSSELGRYRWHYVCRRIIAESFQLKVVDFQGVTWCVDWWGSCALRVWDRNWWGGFEPLVTLSAPLIWSNFLPPCQLKCHYQTSFAVWSGIPSPHPFSPPFSDADPPPLLDTDTECYFTLVAASQ